MRKLLVLVLALLLAVSVFPFNPIMPERVAYAVPVTTDAEFRAALASGTDIEINAAAVPANGLNAEDATLGRLLLTSGNITITVYGMGNAVPLVGFDVVGGSLTLDSRAKATIYKNEGNITVQGGGELSIVLVGTDTSASGYNSGAITLSGGQVSMNHNTSTGNLTVSGGNMTLEKNFGSVTMSNGSTTITENVMGSRLRVNGGQATVTANDSQDVIINGGRTNMQTNTGKVLVNTNGELTVMNNASAIKVDGGVVYVTNPPQSLGTTDFADPLNRKGAIVEADRIYPGIPPRIGGNVKFHFSQAGQVVPILDFIMDKGTSSLSLIEGGGDAIVNINGTRLGPGDSVTIESSIDSTVSLRINGPGVGSKFTNYSNNVIDVGGHALMPNEVYTVTALGATPTPSGSATPTPTGSGTATPTPSSTSGGSGSDGNWDITLDMANRELELGESVKLTASTSAGVGWSTTNAQVASVDRFGVVTAVGLGKALITAALFDPNNSSKLYTATCEITVTQKIKGYRMNPSSLTIFVGEARRVSTSMNPPMATTNEIASFSSNNEDIATADGSGVIMGLAPGIAVITASLVDSVMPNHTFTAGCVVTVLEPVPVTSLTLDADSVILPSNSRARLTATVLPANYSTPNLIEWASDNPHIVSVDSFGRITAHSGGTAYITASLVDTGNRGRVLSAVCKVSVTERISGIQMDGIDIQDQVEVGQTFTLTPQTFPSNAKGTWKWDFDDTAFDSISGKSLTLTARKVGGYLFSATFTDFLGNKARQTWEVNVIQRVQSLRIYVPAAPLKDTPAPTPTPSASPGQSGSAETQPGYDFDSMRIPKLKTGESLPLRAVISPEDCTELDVEWTSSNSDIVMVSNNGLVTALRPGAVTIRATSLANDKIYDEIVLSVLTPQEASLLGGFPWVLAGIGGGALLLLAALVLVLSRGGKRGGKRKAKEPKDAAKARGAKPANQPTQA